MAEWLQQIHILHHIVFSLEEVSMHVYVHKLLQGLTRVFTVQQKHDTNAHGKGINITILFMMSYHTGFFTFSQSQLGGKLNYGVVNVEIHLYLLALSCSVCTGVSLWLLGPMLTPSITPFPVMFRAQQDMAVDRCAHIITPVFVCPFLLVYSLYFPWLLSEQ